MGLLEILREIVGNSELELEVTNEQQLSEREHEPLYDKGLRKRATLITRETYALQNVHRKYGVVISECVTLNPYHLTPEMVELTQELTKSYGSDTERARAIYDWVCDNIKYEPTARDYKDAATVFEHREGGSFSLAFLYVAMARVAGLDAHSAIVLKDDKGRELGSHGCAVVHLPYEDILVDPSFRVFNINHQDYMVWDDFRAACVYRLENPI
ncbi:hypothetical protein DRJ48_04525 [Candidatus Woesearchaeota archaeon]|nr:transglutaminase-like domain-containing protein [Candidatus Woesearchaeota archaeon]RLE41968.1 MAG: hypothetical protein DRJ48_04525 [Candidatus Woesearchaeota archaeon]